MTFTDEEEEILKLMVADIKIRVKMNIERDNQMATVAPLQQEAKTIQDNLKEKCR